MKIKVKLDLNNKTVDVITKTCAELGLSTEEVIEIILNQYAEGVEDASN